MFIHITQAALDVADEQAIIEAFNRRLGVDVDYVVFRVDTTPMKAVITESGTSIDINREAMELEAAAYLLRKRIRALGLVAADLSRDTGVSRQTVWRWLMGHIRVPVYVNTLLSLMETVNRLSESNKSKVSR